MCRADRHRSPWHRGCTGRRRRRRSGAQLKRPRCRGDGAARASIAACTWRCCTIDGAPLRGLAWPGPKRRAQGAAVAIIGCHDRAAARGLHAGHASRQRVSPITGIVLRRADFARPQCPGHQPAAPGQLRHRTSWTRRRIRATAAGRCSSLRTRQGHRRRSKHGWLVTPQPRRGAHSPTPSGISYAIPGALRQASCRRRR